MYVMEYLIYHLKPFGISYTFVTNSGPFVLQSNETDDEIVVAVLRAAINDKGGEDIIIDPISLSEGINETISS